TRGDERFGGSLANFGAAMEHVRSNGFTRALLPERGRRLERREHDAHAPAAEQQRVDERGRRAAVSPAGFDFFARGDHFRFVTAREGARESGNVERGSLARATLGRRGSGFGGLGAGTRRNEQCQNEPRRVAEHRDSSPPAWVPEQWAIAYARCTLDPGTLQPEPARLP